MSYHQRHICDNLNSHSSTSPRNVCSYCAAIATSPDNRCTSMRRVIQGEQLQIEMIELLKHSNLTKPEINQNNLLQVIV